MEKKVGTKINNPIIWADFPDVDVIRVEDTFYMVSTTMHVMPGCPIMKSKDLANWKVHSYLYDTLEDNETYRLENGKNAYGAGQWATSLRQHNGRYYICFTSNDLKKTFIYQSNAMENGEWHRYELTGVYHDPALLFDKDRVFIIYGNGDIKITELKKDVTGVLDGGINQGLFSTPNEANIMLRCEGCHAYSLNGYYYLIFIEWPKDGNARRRVVCYRSKALMGKYERKIILDDDCGYQNKGIAQGAIFDTADGEWYAMMFQDHGAVGRIPYLMPMTWEDDWPMLGINGKVPKEFTVFLAETEKIEQSISDYFNYSENRLNFAWQWNHNPDNSLWSFTKRKGYLRLENGAISENVLCARNILTQHTEGPKCVCSTRLEIEGMKAGDCAGLIALQSHYGFVGIRKTLDGNNYIEMCTNAGVGKEKVEEQIIFQGTCVYLNMEFDFENSNDIAEFYYSTDGETWNKIGCDLKMVYTLDHFMGYRMGLFNYASLETGGYADFDYFLYEHK